MDINYEINMGFKKMNGKSRTETLTSCLRCLKWIGAFVALTTIAWLSVSSSQDDLEQVQITEAVKSQWPQAIRTFDLRGEVGLVLDLDGFDLGDSEVRYLLKHQNIREVDLSGTRITWRSLEPISRISTLKVLHLRNLPIDDTSFSKFDSPAQLQLLDLSGTRIAFAKPVPSLSSVTTLIAARTRINDAGLKQVSVAFPKLGYLDVSNCRITSACAKSILNMPNIAVVNLSGTDVDRTFLRRLPDAFLKRRLSITLPSVALAELESVEKGAKCVIRIDSYP